MLQAQLLPSVHGGGRIHPALHLHSSSHLTPCLPPRLHVALLAWLLAAPFPSLQELENLHKLEVVHLENFLDGQVAAGKAVPLKDGFKRKRETLLSTLF